MSDWNTNPPPPPPGPPPGGPAGPPGPAPGGFGQPPSGQPAPVEPAPPPAERGKGKVIAGVVAVVALVAAGAFAVTQFTGEESEPAGAASPEQLGERVLTAFEQSDAIAAAELLAPGERDAISDPAFDMIAELERLEVLSDVDLEQVNGVEVTLENQSVSVEETNVDDIVHVNLTADATVSVDASELPTGPVLDENISESELEDTTESDVLELPLVGIQEDGEWYLSLFYTAAESARQSTYDDESGDVPAVPTIDEGVAPSGSDSPEGAVTDMLSALEARDLEAIVAGLDPTEASALQRYAPLYLDDAQAELDETEATFELTEADLSVSGDGSEREVIIEDLGFQFEQDGETATVLYSDGCVTVEANGEEDEVCFSGDGIEAELDNALSDFEDPEPFREFIDAFRDAFSDYEVPGIVVNEVDGQWYVSPIKTFDEGMLGVLEALDADELRDLIDKGEAAIEQFEEEIEASFEDLGD